MKTYLLGVLMLLSMAAVSQTEEKADTWTIKLNNKTILSTSNEDETANTKKLRVRDLTSAKSSMDISYTQGRVRTGFHRSINFYDENDKQLLTKKIKSNIRLNNKELKKLAAAGKTIKIYTIAIPSDPEIAATVRVRRVHLCTLEL
jgi:hypothetical protein